MAINERIPDNCVLDVHDVAAIILDAHASIEPLFAHAQLLEVNNGNAPLVTFPEHLFHSSWHERGLLGQKRVAYVLETNSSAKERAHIDTFAAAPGVKTSTGRELTRRELEDVYWRCKDCNAGYVLAYAAQRVFDSLPPTATLRVRTSTQHEITCKPSEVTVAEIDVCPKEACLMVMKEPRPDLGPSKVNMEQHLSGFSERMPWVFLLLGIGGRGGGAEPFALERAIVYHERVLAKVADESERYQLSGKIRIVEDRIRRHGDAVVKLVMGRIAKLAAGEDHFCRYCGKDGVETRCSKCKKAYFCPPCQALGWKYHKVWCS